MKASEYRRKLVWKARTVFAVGFLIGGPIMLLGKSTITDIIGLVVIAGFSVWTKMIMRFIATTMWPEEKHDSCIHCDDHNKGNLTCCWCGKKGTMVEE